MTIGSVQFRVQGIVQGVGFRPFVYRLATRLGLSGRVRNQAGSVVIHLEGMPKSLGEFRKLLIADPPPGARIVGITARSVPAQGYSDFVIAQSGKAGPALSTIPPDIAVCPLCSTEMGDPANRRHRYPFINCTGCGPRFTIAKALPYDRARTSMAAFVLCADCRREYEDPADRRFHAEPNACPACGPAVTVAGPDGSPVVTDDPVGYAVSSLQSGRIVAVRSLGGFQLAVDATDDAAVRVLRRRKDREEKPFAVMVADVETAKTLARLSARDVRILSSPASPVLLLESVFPTPLSPAVAPGMTTVGLFLPYTPLHRLILAGASRPLVMTSGNRTEEPIITRNEEALARLQGIADLFVLHNREIVQRSDDSVVRRVRGRAYPIRRARGFVPAPIVLRPRTPRGKSNADAGVAGLGGEIKNTFCIVKEGLAYLSQHIGDLDRVSVREFYAGTFHFFRRFLDVAFRAVCRDLHPGYFTTAFAETVEAGRIVPLQHHRAHLYSLMAERGFSGRAVGVAFDGTGYGEDGAIWGGEFFAVDGMEMHRAAALEDFPLQGGDSSVNDPWKTALSVLREALGPREGRETALRLFRGVDTERIALVLDALEKRVNVVPTSSCGRLFDAAAAIAGVCRRATYEGQAPMLLEAKIARVRPVGRYDFRIRDDGDGLPRVDWKDAVVGLASDAGRGIPVPVIARRFHDTVAAMILETAERLGDAAGTRTVLLSGGVFQNGFLLNALLANFGAKRWKTVIHREVPANDGGISLGQAYYAARMTGGG